MGKTCQHIFVLLLVALVAGEQASAQPPTGSPSPDETPAATSEPVSTAEPEPVIEVPQTLCEGHSITSVTVSGLRRTTEDDVLASADLSQGQRCSDAKIHDAAQAIWDLGYFEDIVLEGDASGDGIAITLNLTERPAVARILYEGLDELDKDDLKDAVTLDEGSILSLPSLRHQITKIRDAYAEKGYFMARVDYRLERVRETEVDVTFVIDEGEKATVRRIRFVGNRNIPDEELRKFMQTSETGFFSFLSSNNSFKRAMFDDDVTRLQALYYDRGYLSVRLGTPQIALTPNREYLDITIPIEEGPRFKIGRMGIREVDEMGVEVEPLGGRRHLREQIELEQGDWFSRSSIAKNLQDITAEYRDQGYARVEVNPETELDATRRIVHITVAIRRGPIVHIERININGNQKTRDLVIRREIQIGEGDTYSQTLVERSKNRILALGFFERADVSEEQGNDPDSIVLNFEVVERSTGQFQVGAGFSSQESFILTSQIQEQNLFGRGQRLSLQLQLSGVRQLVQLSFAEPNFLNTDWTVAVEAFKTIRSFQAFNRDSTGGSLTFGHPLLDDDLRLFLTYKADYVDISTRTGGLFGGGGGGQQIYPRLPLYNLYRDGLTSSLRASVSWDSRDNRISPTKGVYASYSAELSDDYLGSDNIFLRHSAFARFYYPIFGSFVLKLNTEFGLITSRDPSGVPVFERFFLGGIYNLRGFELNSIGPRAGLTRFYDPTSSVRSAGESIGGNMQAFYNLELEFPILESVGIRGVVFTDGGNAWNLEHAYCQAPEPTLRDQSTNPCNVDPLDLRTSWGFGIRWTSPLGPLRFEWGLPFKPRSYEDDIHFEFTIGNFF